MMKKYDKSVKINYNQNCSQIPNHVYWILIIGTSGSDKNYVSLNLIKHQRPDVKKV